MDNLVSIVIPTRNEEGSVKRLMLGISATLVQYNIKHERIVVDDSTDKTAEIAKKYGARVIKGKRLGLGQAIIDGIEASQGDVVVIMDADGSHMPQDIPRLLKPILEQGADMTIGSRFIEGATCEHSGSTLEKVVAKIARVLAVPVTRVKDSTTGFFAFRKSILED